MPSANPLRVWRSSKARAGSEKMSVCEAHASLPLTVRPRSGQTAAPGEAEGDDAHEAGESRGRGVEHGGWVSLGMGLMGQKGSAAGGAGSSPGSGLFLLQSGGNRRESGETGREFSAARGAEAAAKGWTAVAKRAARGAAAGGEGVAGGGSGQN